MYVGNDRCPLGHLVTHYISGLGKDTPSGGHRGEEPHTLLDAILEVLQTLQVLSVHKQEGQRLIFYNNFIIDFSNKIIKLSRSLS